MEILEKPLHPEVRTSDWLLSVFVANIPFIGFIMLVVWALDSSTNPSKRNWAKAKLIWLAVIFALFIIFGVFVAIGFFSGFFDNFDYERYSSDWT